MEQGERPPWFRRTRYIVLMVFIVVILVASFLPAVNSSPKTRDRIALDGAVAYFAKEYNFTTGLVQEFPGSHSYWLYSDNYLAVLALSRYGTTNSSVAAFASAIYSALRGYASTVPPQLLVNQYEALNSSVADFNCSRGYTLTWSHGSEAPSVSPVTSFGTVANDGPGTCASSNYADLIFLQAVYYHRTGSSQALVLYQRGANDFDGVGLKDLPFENATSSPTYQTFKLALYIYAGACLGEQSLDPNYPKLLHILLAQQDNSTGGFNTGYSSLTGPSAHTPNTETTALVALALEELIRPSASC